MAAIRIRKTIDSETLTLPELRPFIGRTVEIVIEVSNANPTIQEFWNLASQLPTTETEFEEQRKVFETWRHDPRFESHWPTIDQLLARDFEKTRKWAEVLAATWNMQDYDFDAIRDQREFDLKHANDHLK